MHQVRPGTPKGCASALDTEVVLAFQHATNMEAAMHHLTAAMVWWGEPICSISYPQRGRHMREYASMRSSYPSGTQMHV